MRHMWRNQQRLNYTNKCKPLVAQWIDQQNSFTEVKHRPGVVVDGVGDGVNDVVSDH